MAQILKNNVSGVLGLALSASATSMTLLDASSFPTPPEGDFYLLTLIGLNANGQEASWEIVKVTGKASNTLTVVRAQEGTPAAAWPVATTAQLRLTADSVVTPGVVASHIGATGTAHGVATTSAAGFMSAADKTKLDGVATGATAYTHPAKHPASIITQDASNRFVSDTEKTAWNGKEAAIATGTTAQYWRGDKTWRDFFTDVRAATLTGLSTATNAVISATDTVLGALGKLQKQVSDNLTTLTSHTGNTSNPHSVTKAQVGLGNVDNTSDADKPVSAATQAAFAALSDAPIRLNPSRVTTGFTVPSGYNAASVGPIAIAEGVTVTIQDRATWSVH